MQESERPVVGIHSNKFVIVECLEIEQHASPKRLHQFAYMIFR